MLVSRTKPCMPQNHCIAGICAWLITSDVICRKNVAVIRKIGYLVRNAKLIHELRDVLHPTWAGGLRQPCLQRGVQRMNEIKTNAAPAAATLSSVDSIHSVRKPVNGVF